MKSNIAKLFLTLALMVGAQRGLAQSYSLEEFNLDLGGGTSSGGGFEVSGSMVPMVGAAMSGGTFALEGEFLGLTPGVSPDVEPTIIFDNTTGEYGGGSGITETAWLATRFCLKSQNYELASISLLLTDSNGGDGPPSTIKLSLYSSEPSNNLIIGKPATNTGLIMNLSSHTNPVALKHGLELVEWTNATPFSLQADTCYWVVLRRESGGPIGQIASATAPTGDAGSFGASGSVNAGLTWGPPTEHSNNKMLVKGTAPSAPTPLMVSGVSISEGELRFSFTAASGRSYVIEYRADVAAGEWTEIPSTTTVGNGAAFEVIIPAVLDQPQQFFRVKQSP